MKDKLQGRPIRLNRRVLSHGHAPFAEVIFLGDWHVGSPQCDMPRLKGYLHYCVKNNVYVMLMGDLAECATRHSVGSGVYEQDGPAQVQHEQIVSLVKPLAEKGLVLGAHMGN